MMPLVGVINKAIGPKELEMASRGITPPDLGGGLAGSRGVPRGFPDPQGGHGGGQIFRPASDKYHERMKGGADIPQDRLRRVEEGIKPIAHAGSEAELASTIAEGGDPDAARDRMHRLLAQARRGGSSLGAIMGRMGEGRTRNWFEGTDPNTPGGIPAQMMHGTQVSPIPGTTEIAPWKREGMELGAQGLDAKTGEPIHPTGEESQRHGGKVGVRGTSPLAQLRDRAEQHDPLKKPFNPFQQADKPEGDGGRHD